MILNTPRARLLSALYMMSQENENIDIFSIAEEAGLSVYRALVALNDLDERGLCNPRRLTLTLKGLAAAAALTRDERRREVWTESESAATTIRPKLWVA